MNADANDKQLFHCLIRRQQASKQTISTLSIEDVKLHFENLALPQKKTLYDQQWMKIVEDDVKSLTAIEKNLPPNKIPITHLEISTAIRNLNRKKAYDEFGVSAEHLQKAEIEIVPFLTSSINSTIQVK